MQKIGDIALLLSTKLTATPQPLIDLAHSCNAKLHAAYQALCLLQEDGFAVRVDNAWRLAEDYT